MIRSSSLSPPFCFPLAVISVSVHASETHTGVGGSRSPESSLKEEAPRATCLLLLFSRSRHCLISNGGKNNAAAAAAAADDDDGESRAA